MDHIDLIVIGSGPGGASLDHRQAPTGTCILMLEHGDDNTTGSIENCPSTRFSSIGPV